MLMNSNCIAKLQIVFMGIDICTAMIYVLCFVGQYIVVLIQIAITCSHTYSKSHVRIIQCTITHAHPIYNVLLIWAARFKWIAIAKSRSHVHIPTRTPDVCTFGPTHWHIHDHMMNISMHSAVGYVTGIVFTSHIHVRTSTFTHWKHMCGESTYWNV